MSSNYTIKTANYRKRTYYNITNWKPNFKSININININIVKSIWDIDFKIINWMQSILFLFTKRWWIDQKQRVAISQVL